MRFKYFKNNLLKNTYGFSIVELAVGVAVTLVITLASTNYINKSQQITKQLENKNDARQKLKTELAKVQKIFRLSEGRIEIKNEETPNLTITFYGEDENDIGDNIIYKNKCVKDLDSTKIKKPPIKLDKNNFKDCPIECEDGNKSVIEITKNNTNYTFPNNTKQKDLYSAKICVKSIPINYAPWDTPSNFNEVPPKNYIFYIFVTWNKLLKEPLWEVDGMYLVSSPSLTKSVIITQ